jgi:hypothetical protein
MYLPVKDTILQTYPYWLKKMYLLKIPFSIQPPERGKIVKTAQQVWGRKVNDKIDR